jgi:hypothetical protein
VIESEESHHPLLSMEGIHLGVSKVVIVDAGAAVQQMRDAFLMKRRHWTKHPCLRYHSHHARIDMVLVDVHNLRKRDEHHHIWSCGLDEMKYEYSDPG